MKRFILLVLLTVLVSCSKKDASVDSSAGNSAVSKIVKPLANVPEGANPFDSYSGAVRVEKSEQPLKLTKIAELSSFTDIDGQVNELPFQVAAFSTADSVVYAFNFHRKAFMAFKSSEFVKGGKPFLVKEKKQGGGPNDIQLPIDMVYDSYAQKIYIADLFALAVIVYDQKLEEVGRIRLNDRCDGVSFSENYIFATHYTGVTKGQKAIYRIKKTDYSVEKIIPSSTKGEMLETFSRNKLFFAAQNDSVWFSARTYPDFNIYQFNEKSIFNVFANPKLAHKSLPLPVFKVIDNDRKWYGVFAYHTLVYAPKNQRIFTIAVDGWQDLMAKHNLENMLCVYDINGNTLVEYPLTGEETVQSERSSLMVDENSDLVYYFNGGKTFVYKLEAGK